MNKTRLVIHLIFTCKYRKCLLDLFGEEIKDYLRLISKDFEIQEAETDKNHIHLMVKYPPTLSVTSIVRKLKQETTFHIWEKHKLFLKRHFWKENTFWTNGYFAFSIGDASIDTVKRYIREQGN